MILNSKYIYYEHNSFVLCNWKSHFIILALRSIIVTDDDDTTVRFLGDGLFVLSIVVVWSENESTLTLSNIESGVDGSDWDRSRSYS